MGLLNRIKEIFEADTTPKQAAKEESTTATILEKITPYKRSTWMPSVEEAAAEEATATKIGGTAYLPPSEAYPLCPNCGKTLTLFLQLNPNSLPKACDLDLEPDKLVQLFYCTSKHPHCELACQAWQPFSKSVLARTVPLPATEIGLPTTTVEGQFPAKQVTDWIENEDFPDWHEMQLGAAGLTEREVELLEELEAATPKAADKLGGWPYWVQGVEYPSCPECGIQMQMIFQLDSDNHLPYMFGDAGVGHLHQCRLHKHQLAFGWASY